MNSSRTLLRSVGTVLFLLLAAVDARAGEGFGTLSKKVAYLERVRPPVVHIPGTRIAVRAKAQAPKSEPAAQRLQSQLESELLSGDKRFSPDPGNPETVVDVTVVEDQASDRWENRTETRSVDTGTKDEKGKKIYRQVQEQVRYQVLSARFGIAYKVVDTRTGANLDADSISWNVTREFREGQGAPAPGELESQGIDVVLRDLTRRLTPTPERVGVLLPKGSLDDIGNLAKAGLWDKYQEALSALPPRPRKEDEAYRQYALGLTYEALGYAAETPEQTLKYLQQASIHYDNALEANPQEKYFSQPYDRKSFGPSSGEGRSSFGGFLHSQTFDPPHQRVKAALVQYQKLFDALVADRSTKVKPLPPGPGATEPAVASDVLDNTGVIRLVASGLPENIILNALEGAEKTAFDLSANGLVALTEARVSPRIIERMQQLAKQRPRTAAQKGRS
jgi:hypothetical protein